MTFSPPYAQLATTTTPFSSDPLPAGFVAKPGRWAVELGFAAALGGFALIDPNGLTPGRRALLRCSEAVIVAGMTAWSLRVSDEGPVRAPVSGYAVGAAGLSLGMAELSERLDARLVTGLRRRGVRRPRVLMAAATVALQIASAAIDIGRGSQTSTIEEVQPSPGALPDTARRILDAIIAADDRIDGGALAAQLDGARAEHGEDADGDDWLSITVNDAAPRSPLETYTHPAVVHAHAPGGRLVHVELRIEAGALFALNLRYADDAGSDHHDWSYSRWSALALDSAELIVGFGDAATRLPFPSTA